MELIITTMDTLLVVSTIIRTAENVIPIIMKYAMTWIFPGKRVEQKLKDDMLQLEHEMSVTSMADEFSKYTKMRRKHTKLKENHEKEVGERLSRRRKTQLIVTYFVKLLGGIITMILVNFYGGKPIVILPRGILWPLNGILSWPGTHQDSISLVIWVGVITLAIPRSFCEFNHRYI